MKAVKELFANDIHRRIEEVIKVDQADAQIIRDEIAEYVATDSIKRYFAETFDQYWRTLNHPHEGIAIWVSGFFGSGKSSFAKLLGLAIDNRPILGDGAADLFADRTGDSRIKVLLKQITEHIPTESVIFDVSTDRGIRTGNQSITEIMYRLFLQHMGYARDIDLAELEIILEADGRLQEFTDTYASMFGKEWDIEKGKVAFAMAQASQVMHRISPESFPADDTWLQAARSRADITPGLLAERCKELMARRRPGKNLLFVVDEVGQFVARDVQKMLDLQAVVQSLGRVGRGKLWIAVTSQEKLNELVGGLDDKRVELARLMDRFPTQVHLEPADISEVTSKRILSKNAGAEHVLRDLFTQHRGRLTDNTRLTADIRLPELTAESFIDLYPLLPYQVDLIIQVVSGLRTQGGAIKHVGGANRTIIKLAQQLLIHPDVNLAEQPVGRLVRIDQIYDLVAGNIPSEIRGKIDDIPNKVNHPLAQAVAKAICLLQYVKSIHRTAENIAASLHDAIDGDSRLPEVRAALEELVSRHQVRLGDDGYRIPSPVEDDWERQRGGLAPSPAETNRIRREVVTSLWQPQPGHSFLNVKQFKAGLYFNGQLVVDGEIPFYLTLADAGSDYQREVFGVRERSQRETRSIFWISAIDDAIDRETIEYYRSSEMVEKKQRSAQTRDETALVAEEKKRRDLHLDELKRRIKQALLAGSIYFRGNDRSPDPNATEIGHTAAKVLAQALPDVYSRFKEAAAQVKSTDLNRLMETENLRGLTPVFTALKLVHDQNGKPVFTTDSGPLAEVLVRIENRTSQGELASGHFITDEFAKEPFGWDFDVVRLFVVCLLRAGKIEATSKGIIIDSALSLEAMNTFGNNNLFRQASFRLKTSGVVDFAQLVIAVDAYRDVFGKEIPEIEQSVVAKAIKEEIGNCEDALRETYTTLVQHSLPGAGILQEACDQMKAMRQGRDDVAITTFNGSYKELKEAIKRSGELQGALAIESNLAIIASARQTLTVRWPFLQGEADLLDSLTEHAAKLTDLMDRETFFRELPAIDAHAKALEAEYQHRYQQALQARVDVYSAALEKLQTTPGWADVTPDQQQRISEPLTSRTSTTVNQSLSIPLLRADVEACSSRLNKAIEEVLRLLDGQRVVTVSAGNFFSGGIETEEQLEAALTGLRDECERLIGAGKKVLVQ